MTIIYSKKKFSGDDYFEVRVEEVNSLMAGTLKIGLTTCPPSSNGEGAAQNVPHEMTALGSSTIWLEDTRARNKRSTSREQPRNSEYIFQVRHNGGKTLKVNYCPSLERLTVGDRVGVRLVSGGSVRFALNGDDLGVAANDFIISRGGRAYPVVELSGAAVSVAAISSSIVAPSRHGQAATSPGQESQHSGQHNAVVKGLAQAMQDSLEVGQQQQQPEPDCELPQQPLTFHCNHGKNVTLKDGSLRAVRGESYNQGLVLSNRPLARDEMFKVTIGRLNKNWSSSLLIGEFSSPYVLTITNLL